MLVAMYKLNFKWTAICDLWICFINLLTRPLGYCFGTLRVQTQTIKGGHVCYARRLKAPESSNALPRGNSCSAHHLILPLLLKTCGRPHITLFRPSMLCLMLNSKPRHPSVNQKRNQARGTFGASAAASAEG